MAIFAKTKKILRPNLEKGKQIRATELRNWGKHVDALVEMGRTIILPELCICARKSGIPFLEKNQLKFNFLVSVKNSPYAFLGKKKCRHNFIFLSFFFLVISNLN